MMIWVVRVICSIEVSGVWLIDVLGLLLSLFDRTAGAGMHFTGLCHLTCHRLGGG